MRRCVCGQHAVLVGHRIAIHAQHVADARLERVALDAAVEDAPRAGRLDAQAVLVDDESAVDRAKKYAQYCDLILTDSGLAPDTGIGASGLTHDWSIDARIVAECGKPVIMAGGLGPDNVAEAIEQCKPYGVDSLTKTSIKYDGGYMEKDIDKVRQFCINADAAAAKIGQ